jgi:hypothetical protein
MEKTSLKNIEFSILAIVNRCNRVTRTMAYLEIKKRSEFYYLFMFDFSEKWNHLVNNKCLLFIDESEPEKGVKINPDKNCLIIYGLIEFQNEHKRGYLNK